MNIDWNKIQKAIEVIKSGICDRFDIGNIIVYKCGTIIRIDVKDVFAKVV